MQGEPEGVLAEIYNTCVRCGLCLPTCPTYLETMTETSGPRGRISLVKAVDEGRIDLLSPGFVEQMSQCLDCRACQAVCPSGVQYGTLVETMRARIEEASAPSRPALQRTLRGFLINRLFTNLAWMRFVASLTRFAQRTGLMALARIFGLGKAAALAPRIAETYFLADGQHVNVPGAAGTAFLHVGCVMQVAYPHVHEASMRMLSRAGLSVDVGAGQGCCGAIAVHAGEPRVAIDLAKKNIEAFERSGADVYVVNAAGCGSTLKEYGHLLKDEPRWHERAERFASRVRDITEVLDAMEWRGTPRSMDIDVTYQEPCHLAHAQKVSAAPRRILGRIPGLRLIEMNESSVCCGSAGIYGLTQPEMSKSLQERKVENIRATRATVVATANPGCAMQVAAGLKRAGIDAEVKHIVEILDDAFTGTPSKA